MSLELTVKYNKMCHISAKAKILMHNVGENGEIEKRRIKSCGLNVQVCCFMCPSCEKTRSD